MIFSALECILIIACMMRSVAVSIIVWTLIAALLYMKKESWPDFWVQLLIASVPISYMTIFLSDGGKIFKWYNIALLGLDLTVLLRMKKQNAKVNRNVFLTLVSILLFQLVRNLLLKKTDHLLVELMQEYAAVITVWMFFEYIRMERANVTNLYRLCEKWTSLYLNTTLASGVCVIAQREIYLFTGRLIGKATIWAGRQNFDMTFTGYSVLSVFLGGGMVIAVINLLHSKRKTLSFVQLLFLAYACVVNSARSGLFASIVIILLMLLQSLRRYGTAKRALLFGIPIIIGMIISLFYLLQTRTSLQIVGLFDATGRQDLIDQAFQIMTSNASTFLFGVGVNGAEALGISAQHNMFLEMWVLNGTILLIPFVIVVFMILWKTRRRKNRYLLWQLLFAHQFYSSFFATTFLPVVLILTFGSYDEYNI